MGDACGWWRARSAVLFPASPDPGGVVVMLVVRVVWAPEWMIVSVAPLLARVVWALASVGDAAYPGFCDRIALLLVGLYCYLWV